MSVTVSQELEAKRDRLLTSGSVTVLYVNGPRIRATVRGEHRTYRVSMDDGKQLACTCAAATYGRLCSHMMSVALVVDGPWRESADAA